MDLAAAIHSALPTTAAKWAATLSLPLAAGSFVVRDLFDGITLTSAQTSVVLSLLMSIMALLLGALVALSSVVLSHRRLEKENADLREQAGLKRFLNNPIVA